MANVKNVIQKIFPHEAFIPSMDALTAFIRTEIRLVYKEDLSASDRLEQVIQAFYQIIPTSTCMMQDVWDYVAEIAQEALTAYHADEGDKCKCDPGLCSKKLEDAPDCDCYKCECVRAYEREEYRLLQAREKGAGSLEEDEPEKESEDEPEETEWESEDEPEEDESEEEEETEWEWDCCENSEIDYNKACPTCQSWMCDCEEIHSTKKKKCKECGRERQTL